MTDYIFLSATTPCNEPCAQLNHTSNYLQNAKLEAHVYIMQLKRAFGENPEGTKFLLAYCPHDFGTYIDIKFFYDDENDAHIDYMNSVETGCEKWDRESLKELRDKGYNLKNENEEVEDEENGEPWEESLTTDNRPTGHGDVCISDADSGL